MSADTWSAFRDLYCRVPELGLSIDVSRMGFPDGYLDKMKPNMDAAFKAMSELEGGAIANPDEDRMVGHYWLRDPSKAPNDEIRNEIESTLQRIKEFAAGIHQGQEFQDVLCVGIGGSALGPQFVRDALGSIQADVLHVEFIDNTDPDGIARILAGFLDLDEVLTIVTSKSGGTPETHNGMKLVRAAYEEAEVDFTKHAVAITMPGSKLDKLAESEGWLARFPMFDWVGGRTSELSAVGLLPAALQGIDIDGMLEGARICDEATRSTDIRKNPAALLALAWHHATNGKGEKDMVVLPYKDRLLLFSRYLQQLVMESIGKREDLKGNVVEQGIAVYGNKGSTDQHAYVQQLRDGVNNFFAVFVRVLEDGGERVEVNDDGTTAGDYLHGFLMGTRQALWEGDRQSITISVRRVEPRTVGALIALFERAVGFYATMVNINAYHQPGVEAGKKAAAGVLALREKVVAALADHPRSAEEIAKEANGDAESVFLLLEHLASNGSAKVEKDGSPGEMTFLKA